MRCDRLASVALLALALAACSGEGKRREAADADVAELRALVDTMLPSLARLASLEPKREVKVERRDSAQVRAYVERRLDQEMPAEKLASLHATYALLGLVPDTLQLRPLLLRLYTEQIIGYYDPQERALYVVEGVAAASVAPVLAHELVHALQDQYANLDSLISGQRGSDPQTAAHAAFEGHATIVMFAYLAEHAEKRRLDPVTLPNPATSLRAGLEQQNEQFPVFREAPAILRETLLFPYVAGADFMYRLWQAERLDRPAPLGRWLPQSTEQVLHARERFLLRRDDPTALTLSPQQGEWQVAAEDNGLGELETGIFLVQHLGASARRLSHGWDGDVYRLLRNPQGEHALVWYSIWDDAAAAERFADALRRVDLALQPQTRVSTATLTIAARPLVRAVFHRTVEPPAAALPTVCITGEAGCSEARPPAR